MDIIREQEKLDEELSLDIASRMQSTCYRLCTENVYRPNLKNPELSNSQSSEGLHSSKKLGDDENACLDNCAFKYLTAQRRALEYVNEITNANMAKSQENAESLAGLADFNNVEVAPKKKKRFFGLL